MDGTSGGRTRARYWTLLFLALGAGLAACGETSDDLGAGSGGSSPGSGGQGTTGGAVSSGGASNPSGGNAEDGASDGGNPSGGNPNLGGEGPGSGGALVGADCEAGDPEVCAGENQRDLLTCKEGEWSLSRSCALGSQCDTASDECVTIVEECRDLDPGDRFCGDDESLYECGADRVSSELVEDCAGLCDADAAACKNDCAIDHGGCDALVSCTSSEAGAVCGACPSGYAGSGSTDCAPLLLEFGPGTGTLNPAFSSQVTSYLLAVPIRVETVTFSGATVEGAEVSINGQSAFVGGATWTTPTLAWGATSFAIEVSREGSLPTTYQLTVRRGIETRLKASNANVDDYFGEVIALSGDGSTLVVGAYGEASAVPSDPTNDAADVAGAAYVFRRTGDAWAQEAYLKSPSPDEWDFFGTSVAVNVDGSVVAVGASDEDGGTSLPSDNSLEASGAVFVFQRSGASFGSPAYIKPTVRNDFASFGRAVALSADGVTLAVGSNDDSNATGINGNASNTGATNSGAAYVFVRSGSAWSQQAYIKASNTGGGDGFGRSVALAADGSTLIVSAPEEKSLVAGDPLNNAGSNVGAVYVFSRTGSNWAPGTYLKASNPDSEDYFGDDIDISADGTTLVVGTSRESSAATTVNGDEADDSAPEAGAAYVFTKSGANWTKQAYLKASNAQTLDGFGSSVSLAGDGNTLLVGAMYETGGEGGFNANQQSNSWHNGGAVYAFRRNGSTWTQTTYLKADEVESAYFGCAVSLSDNALFFAIGAYTQGGSGAAYVY
jgi:hypothetical protein